MRQGLFKRRKFWFNLHLTLAIVCALPLFIVALSGCVISYHDEIIELFESKTQISNAGKPLPVSEILTKFREQKGDFSVSYVSFKKDGGAIKISGIDGTGAFNSYFVDPYSGGVISQSAGDKIVAVAMNLHKNLGLALINPQSEALNFTGKQISAVSTAMLILLIISGVIIYYPSFRTKILRAFTINFKARGYNLLYKIHAAAGVYSAAVLLVICFTGLYFSYDFIARGTNKILGESEILRRPNYTQTRGLNINETDKFSRFDEVLKIFKSERGENYEFLNIAVSRGAGVFNCIYADAGEEGEERVSSMSIDGVSGKILRNLRFDDANAKPPRPLAITKFMLNLHAGYVFGEAGKFIFCLSSFLVAAFIITGFLMTAKRARL